MSSHSRSDIGQWNDIAAHGEIDFDRIFHSRSFKRPSKLGHQTGGERFRFSPRRDSLALYWSRVAPMPFSAMIGGRHERPIRTCPPQSEARAQHRTKM